MKKEPSLTLTGITILMVRAMLMDRVRRRKLLFACTLGLLVYVAVGVYFRDPMSLNPLFFIGYWVLAVPGLLIVMLLALYDMLRALAETRSEVREHFEQALEEMKKAKEGCVGECEDEVDK